MERSAIGEIRCRGWTVPDFAALHPGYDAVIEKRIGASYSVIASAAKQSRIFPRRRSGLLRRKGSSQWRCW